MSGLKKLIAAAGAGAILVSGLAANVSAVESYDPYSYDRWGDAVASQVGYTAEYFVDGQSINGLAEVIEAMDGFNAEKASWQELLGLKEPADMYVSADDLMYIADKGNNRILVTDLDFNLVNYMDTFHYNGEELTLKKPEGVFVDQYTGYIYVCDTENSRVLKSDKDGNVDMIFEKPVSEIYSQDLTFNPKKVAVDKAGNVYIVVKSVTKGSVMYDINGEFLGFFGANRVEATGEVLMNAFWKLIFSREQAKKMRRSVPVEISNFDIDTDNFIYTVTESKSAETDILKKLNSAGTNIFTNLGYSDYTFGDALTKYYRGQTYSSQITDIDVAEDGVINLLDLKTGRVFQYDDECNLLFIFGGIGQQKGTFNIVNSVESKGDRVYVLDGRKCSVTVFKQTEFGSIVHNAIALFNKGKYEEARGPWEEALRRDSNYWLAYIGLGNAYLNEGQYDTAMKYFYHNSKTGYNDAFKSWRMNFIRDNFTLFAVIIIALLAFIYIFSTWRGKVRAKKRAEQEKLFREKNKGKEDV